MTSLIRFSDVDTIFKYHSCLSDDVCCLLNLNVPVIALADLKSSSELSSRGYKKSTSRLDLQWSLNKGKLERSLFAHSYLYYLSMMTPTYQMTSICPSRLDRLRRRDCWHWFRVHSSSRLVKQISMVLILNYWFSSQAFNVVSTVYMEMNGHRGKPMFFCSSPGFSWKFFIWWSNLIISRRSA